MHLTAKFLSGKDPDEVKIKELVNGLKGIYVKSFEFERDGDYSQADIESIRSQLRTPAWSKILNVSSKKEGSVEVYLMSNASQVGGLVVVATDLKELTIVNIVGPVDLEKIKPARRAVWRSRTGNRDDETQAEELSRNNEEVTCPNAVSYLALVCPGFGGGGQGR